MNSSCLIVKGSVIRIMFKACESNGAGKKNVCKSSRCLKAKDGTMILEKEEILKRWEEYIKELFEDNRGNLPEIKKNMKGLKILQSEVRSALNRMKRNKAARPDEIKMEQILPLEEFGIKKLTE